VGRIVREELDLGGVRVATRPPLAVAVLGVVTLGVYFMVWWYAVNREVHDLGARVDPLVALLAVTAGAFLVVPPFVSAYNTAERVAELEQRAGMIDRLNPAVVLGLWLAAVPTLGITWAYANHLTQRHLNALYERLRDGDVRLGRRAR
jgi:hypothetical protein